MTKISAAEFIKMHQKAGKVSKLEPFREDILLLKSKGYTQQQILDFLKMNGVTAGMTTLNWFIRSRKDNMEFAHAAQRTSVETAPAVIEKPAKHTPSTKPNEIGEPRKFNWGAVPSDEELFGSSEKKRPEDGSEPGRPRKFEWNPAAIDTEKLL